MRNFIGGMMRIIVTDSGYLMMRGAAIKHRRGRDSLNGNSDHH